MVVCESDEDRLEKLNGNDAELDSHRGTSRRNRSGRHTPEAPFLRKTSAWFGEKMKGGSRFYTFSSNHPLKCWKELETVAYKEALLLDGIRILWTPVRRDSVIACPEVFREKALSMRGIRPPGLRDYEVQSGHGRALRCVRRSGVKFAMEHTKSSCTATDSVVSGNRCGCAESCSRDACAESGNGVCGALIGKHHSMEHPLSHLRATGFKASESAKLGESEAPVP
jgi:hypothetical protein